MLFGQPSLTEGYHSGGSAFHSYALRLKELVAGALPPGFDKAVVEERGYSGEFVVPDMKNRLLQTLDAAAAKGARIDWVLLLGGTNDVCSDGMASEVLETLLEMHGAVLRSGANLVVMTLPPFNCQVAGRVHKQYTQLNEGLRLWYGGRSSGSSGAGEGGGRAVFVDLEPLFPTGGADPLAEQLLWCDGLHLRPAGYRRMADAVFEAMKPHLDD